MRTAARYVTGEGVPLADQCLHPVLRLQVLPTGTPLIAWSRQLGVSLENGTGFQYDPTHPVPDWVIRDQRHAYYAAVSYVDEHIGYILQTLESTGLETETVVLFHADVRTQRAPSNMTL